MRELERLAAYCVEQGIPCLRRPKMRDYTTFRIGGEAEVLVEPADVEQISQVLAFCSQNSWEPLLLGNGSDLLIDDAGLSRPVLHLGTTMGPPRLDEDGALFAPAGLSLKRLCVFAQENGLTGLEFAYGIPGTVGGAAVMNAGAYGGEMKDVVESTACVEHDGTRRELRAADCAFGYRHSVFQTNGACVTGVHFRLKPGPRDEIMARMTDLMARRTAKQPLEYPSAGSTFKRPATGYAAALIEQCGLKGRRVGGAMVSEKHAGFLINCGHATSADVLELVRVVRETVLAQTGTTLECEMKYLA